jgi:hypothetical protein
VRESYLLFARTHMDYEGMKNFDSVDVSKEGNYRLDTFIVQSAGFCFL